MSMTRQEYELVKLETLLNQSAQQIFQSRQRAKELGFSSDELNDFLKLDNDVNYLLCVVQEKLPKFKKGVKKK